MSASLQEICASLVRGHRGPSVRLPERTKLEELAVNRPEATSTMRPTRNIVQIARDIYECIVISGEPLSRRQTREASWCLWDRNAELAEHPQVLSAVFDAVALAKRPCL